MGIVAVRNEYDRLAPDYDRRWRPCIGSTLNAVLEGLSLSENAALLDVACGTGELERRLLVEWPTLRLTGIDVSSRMLECAKNKDVNNRVTWLKADVASLPVYGQTFDYVVCANSFHYFRAPSKALLEIHRVLRPGGTLILVDCCDDYWTCKVCSLWLRWVDKAFFRTYSLRDCEALVEAADLRIESSCRFRSTWLWGLMRVVCRRQD